MTGRRLLCLRKKEKAKMADFEDDNNLEEEVIDSYEPPVSPLDVSVLWLRLIELNFSDADAITALEQDVYSAMKSSEDNGAYLIMLIELQFMQGNIERARSLAYQIWEEGGDIPPQIQLLYLQHLIALNLPEMAAEIVNAFMEDVDSLPFAFYIPLLNFSFAFQDVDTLEILAARIEEEGDGPFYDFIDFCEQNGHWETIASLNKIIFQNAALSLADYRISFETEQEDSGLDIILSATRDADGLTQIINRQIENFCQRNDVDLQGRIRVLVEPMANHPQLDTVFLPV